MNNKKIMWSKLDTVAKAFPSTIKKSDTRVFRFSCQLKEEVDPVLLQTSLDRTIEDFPNFLCVMRRGFFWYFLENSQLRPIVSEESKPPCSEIYVSGRKNLLFEVTYYKKRINFEVFHSLTDGTGAMKFLQALVLYYLSEKHSDELGGKLLLPSDTSSIFEKADNSFDKYYQKEKNDKPQQPDKAFKIKGDRRENDNVLITEGIASVKQVIQVAHSYNATMTVFLTAVYIDAIVKEMPMLKRRLPISIGIPVNLRNFFPSETARNFFGIISVDYYPDEHSGEFSEIVSAVAKDFEDKITKENLSATLNMNSALERNPFTRIAPLFIKDFGIRIGRRFGDKRSTSLVSSIGRVEMPQEICKYIYSFNVCVATIDSQLFVCSFEDVLDMGFSSAFERTEIQMNFFRALTNMGIDVTINCNEFEEIEKRGEK